MAAAVMFASLLVQRVKLIFNLARPCELSPRIQPMIATPGFSTFPSGHATESRLVSDLLSTLLARAQAPAGWAGPVDRMLVALADRIAENREVAGVHFSVDSTAGAALGSQLARLLAARADAAARSAGTAAVDGRAAPFAALWQMALQEWAHADSAVAAA